MYVACFTLGFTRLPLTDALKAIRVLKFQKADLALGAAGGHLSWAEITADTAKVAATLKTAGLSFAAFHADLSPELSAALDELRAACRLGRMLAVPVLSVPAAALGSDLAPEIARLSALNKVAKGEGLILTVETHSSLVTADPLGAKELCKRVPGLGLTLDPSHYLVGPHGPVNYDELFPLVRHVRLRDSKPDQFQVRIGQGQMDYARILTQLGRQNYRRALSVSLSDAAEYDFAVDAEVRKLKYLLESMI